MLTSVPERSITQRIDAVTLIPESHRSVICPAPKSVKIELTSRCDLKCYFCATARNMRPKGDIDFEFLKRILKEMREDGVEEIGMFYLGESFLYKKLPQAISFAKELGYPYIFLTTNGRTATFDRVYECAKAGLNSLKFSFNAHDRESYRETTRVDAFKTVSTNIRKARDAVNRAFEETGHLCRLYASSILFDHLQPRRMKEILDEITPYLDEHYWLPLYNQAGLIQYEKDKEPVAGNIGRVGALRESLPCWALFSEGHIREDGMLSACCFDHSGDFIMGDLNRERFMDAWNSPKFQQLRAMSLKKLVKGTVCENCMAYR